MQNHAFLILAHDAPNLIRRNIEKLQSENHYFFLHIDKNTSMKPFEEALGNLANICFLKGKDRIRCSWGGFSLVEAELNLLKKAYSLKKIDYYHLISGHDYACVKCNAFDEFFDNNLGKSFMHYDSEQEIQMWRNNKYADRVTWHFNDSGMPAFFKQKLVNFLNKYFKKKEINNLVAGWQWFSWHKSVVDYVLDFLELNEDFKKQFYYTTCSDEMFFHTMLYDKIALLNIVKDDSLRYIVWYPKRYSKTLPLVLDERDFLDIIESKKLFCRKIYEEQSVHLLDKLDRL